MWAVYAARNTGGLSHLGIRDCYHYWIVVDEEYNECGMDTTCVPAGTAEKGKSAMGTPEARLEEGTDV